MPSPSSIQLGGAESLDLACVYRPLPPTLAQYMEHSDLPWYRISVQLAESRVDPFFRVLAGRTEEKELLLGAGSDIVQLVLGVPKQVCQNLGVEVNCITPKDAPLETLFRVYDRVHVPKFKQRPEGMTNVVLNWESSIDLERIVRNGSQNKYILDGSGVTLFNPLKYTSIAHIPAEGEPYLYFRTHTDYVNFVSKKITLPEIASVDRQAWLAQIDNPRRNFELRYIMQYAATVLARGHMEGWSMDHDSLEFLRFASSHMSESSRTWVRLFVARSFERAQIEPPDLEHTFATLGLSSEQSMRLSA